MELNSCGTLTNRPLSSAVDQYMFLTHTAQGNKPGYKVYVNPTTYQSPTLSNQMSGWYDTHVIIKHICLGYLLRYK